MKGLVLEKRIDRILRNAIDQYGEGAYHYDNLIIRGFAMLTITCPEHGDFRISLDNFIYRGGCPLCRGIHPRGYPKRRNKTVKNQRGRKRLFPLGKMVLPAITVPPKLKEQLDAKARELGISVSDLRVKAYENLF